MAFVAIHIVKHVSPTEWQNRYELHDVSALAACRNFFNKRDIVQRKQNNGS